jgi:hypothetical protein
MKQQSFNTITYEDILMKQLYLLCTFERFNTVRSVIFYCNSIVALLLHLNYSSETGKVQHCYICDLLLQQHSSTIVTSKLL